MSNPRGRPKGYKMSKKSKKQIAKTKTGQSHKQETKDKIANSLVKHFDKIGRKRPMAHAKGVNPGDYDPNTLELNKDLMSCDKGLIKRLKATSLELITVKVTGAMGLDGGEKQSEYFPDSVAGIKGTKFALSMRKRAFYELPNLLIPSEHLLAVLRNLHKKYPTLPLKVTELALRHEKSGNIYVARVYGYIRKQVDRRQLLVIEMNKKKHTTLTPIEYGSMLDDLLDTAIRQCYFEFQMTKSAKLCNIVDVKKPSKRKKSK